MTTGKTHRCLCQSIPDTHGIPTDGTEHGWSIPLLSTPVCRAQGQEDGLARQQLLIRASPWVYQLLEVLGTLQWERADGELFCSGLHWGLNGNST